MLNCILSAIALTAAIGLFIVYLHAEREARLVQLEIDSFRIELIEAGIRIPHKGEKP